MQLQLKTKILACSQPVTTADCGVQHSGGPWFACPVLTGGSWPPDEVDFGASLHSYVLMGIKFIQSTPIRTGTCWSLYISAPEVTQTKKVESFLKGFLSSLSL